jgi:hypothetical protein
MLKNLDYYRSGLPNNLDFHMSDTLNNLDYYKSGVLNKQDYYRSGHVQQHGLLQVRIQPGPQQHHNLKNYYYRSGVFNTGCAQQAGLLYYRSKVLNNMEYYRSGVFNNMDY